jgi:hypothetical protein
MHPDDKELLYQFREAATKEQAFTALVKKYQENSIGISAAWLWIMMMPMM